MSDKILSSDYADYTDIGKRDEVSTTCVSGWIVESTLTQMVFPLPLFPNLCNLRMDEGSEAGFSDMRATDRLISNF